MGAVMLLAACAAHGPQRYVGNAPAAGSTWEMAYHSTGSYGSDKRTRVRLEDRVWKGSRMVAFLLPDGSGVLKTPDHGRYAAILGPGGKTVTEYDPPWGVTVPFKVGDTFDTRSQLTIPGREPPPAMDMRCVVEAFEQVTVPAGTFDAYRTVCTPSSGKSVDTFWVSPKLGINVRTMSTRRSDSNFGPGTQLGELVSHALK